MKKEDKKRFERLKELGCIACGSNEPVIHHIRKHKMNIKNLEKNIRKSIIVYCKYQEFLLYVRI